MSILEKQAADALRRARRLPIGSSRNDLRQLAMLHRNGMQALEQARATNGRSQDETNFAGGRTIRGEGPLTGYLAQVLRSCGDFSEIATAVACCLDRLWDAAVVCVPAEDENARSTWPQ